MKRKSGISDIDSGRYTVMHCVDCYNSDFCRSVNCDMWFKCGYA